MLKMRRWIADRLARMKARTLTSAAGTATLALALPVLLATTSLAATSDVLEDRDVKNAVEGRYLSDATVPFHSIDVDVAQGIVTLSGSVDTIGARHRAVELARTIKGVRSVVNEIQVDPVPRSDDELRRDVEWALVRDPAADSYEVTVSVSDAVARLEGTVDSWQEKQLVTRVVEGVEGLKDVENHITFVVPSARPDTEIEAEIRKRLQWDAWVDSGLITVAVNDGTVTLDGVVGSALERARAVGDAWVPGVENVDAEGLDVEWWRRDEMRRDKYAFKSDDQIRQAVQDAFLYDPRVLSLNPEVQVKNGIVTLSGVVDNLAARRAAERDARNTIGVALVRNHLRVRPAERTEDEEITRRVQQAFQDDAIVDRFEVGVMTTRGEVSLAGEVDSWLEWSHAENVAAAVDGVVDVHNNLSVSYPTSFMKDRVLEEEIEEQLFWSPFVDSDEVNVAVNDGVATLTGTVDTWADHSWAAENARQAGALRVDNDIKVREERGAFWMPF